MQNIFPNAAPRQPAKKPAKPSKTPDVAKVLLDYKDEMRGRHLDCPDLKVEVLEDCGWVQYPTGLWGYIVRLRVSGPGYRTGTPNLTVYADGHFSIR